MPLQLLKNAIIFEEKLNIQLESIKYSKNISKNKTEFSLSRNLEAKIKKINERLEFF